MKIKPIKINHKIVGAGTPILMLHGYAVDHRLLLGCMEPIFEKRANYQRIYLDLPGMGKTKAENWLNNADQMLELLIDFIDKHIAQKEFLLIGQSYGGYLARGIIYKIPDRIKGLALLNPAISIDLRDLPPKKVLLQEEAFLATLTKAERDEFTSLMVVQNAETWSRYRDEILRGLKIAESRELLQA